MAKTKIDAKLQAIIDMNNCLLLDADGIVAPMVESSFALENFITSTDNNIPPQLRKKINFFVNIESKTAYENIQGILNSDSCKYLSGIVWLSRKVVYFFEKNIATERFPLDSRFPLQR